MNIVTSFFCTTLFLLHLTIGVSEASLIGTDLKVTNMFGDWYGPHSLSENSGTNNLDSQLNNMNGQTKASATLSGHLSTSSNTTSGQEYVTATSKSWLVEDIYNNTSFGYNYFLNLDYSFLLVPYAYLPCGTHTFGNVSVLINNFQIADINYENSSSWDWRYIYDERGEVYEDYVVYSGSDLVNASQRLFLGYLDPGESFTLNYSISTTAFGEEHAGSFASSSLYACLSTTPNPVPEPSTFLLLGAGLVGLAVYGRKRTMK